MTKISDFREKGYVLATGILTEETIGWVIANLDHMSRRRRRIGGWTVPDGVSQTRGFWPLIFNEKLLKIGRAHV